MKMLIEGSTRNAAVAAGKNGLLPIFPGATTALLAFLELQMWFYTRKFSHCTCNEYFKWITVIVIVSLCDVITKDTVQSLIRFVENSNGKTITLQTGSLKGTNTQHCGYMGQFFSN